MDEKDRQKIVALVEWRKQQETTEGILEDYYWAPLIEILIKNEQDTIKFLDSCGESILYWISEVFEDVSEHFQSKHFVTFLGKLDIQYPKANLSTDIEYAKMAIEE